MTNLRLYMERRSPEPQQERRMVRSVRAVGGDRGEGRADTACTTS